MLKLRYTEEQIAVVLRQADTGAPVSDLSRVAGVSEGTFYACKKQYADLGVGELRRLNVSGIPTIPTCGI